MFDVSNPNEECRAIKVFINDFDKERKGREDEIKKVKESLKEEEVNKEARLNLDDVEGYSDAKNREEFYRKKLMKLENLEPIEPNLTELKKLIKEERDKVFTEFEEGKEPLEKAFITALINLCEFRNEKIKKYRDLVQLVYPFKSEYKVEVADTIFEYMNRVEVSYYQEGIISLGQWERYVGFNYMKFNLKD